MLHVGVEGGFQRKEERHIEAVVDLGRTVRTVGGLRNADCAVEGDYYMSFGVVVVAVGRRAESKVVVEHHKTDRAMSEVVAAGHIEFGMV